MKKWRWLLICYSAIICIGCSQKNSYKINKSLNTAEKIRLNITGTSPSFKAMENVITSFCDIYPNVTIEYEYLQNYNKSIKTRLSGNDDIDLFMTNNIQTDSPLLPYTLELKSQSDVLDLSSLYEGLIRNFTISENGRDALYAIPFGGEISGLYVNKTLLSSLGLSVPKNYQELLACCKVIKKAGYIPLQGNPGNFGQMFMYPYVCNLISNSKDYKATYEKINNCEPGVSELFREPMSRLYELVADGYYNYKFVETNNKMFVDANDDMSVYDFLNIVTDSTGVQIKKDDKGIVPFMPAVMSLQTKLNKVKSDYHSGIEYEFILAPVGDDGGYAYLSPTSGIAVNKYGAHIEWSLEFLNYLFSYDVNKKFAQDQNIVSNTKDAIDLIKKYFDMEMGRESQLGQVSFDYIFYDVVTKEFIAISKANNPKYMPAENKMYSLEYFMTNLENEFTKQRKLREGNSL